MPSLAGDDGRATVALIQALIPLGLRAVAEALQQEVRALAGTRYGRSDRDLERRVTARFYFATPHHSWARGSNENMNGLIRPYLPKGVTMEHLPQEDCDRIADKRNRRPRKRYHWHTPAELYAA